MRLGITFISVLAAVSAHAAASSAETAPDPRAEGDALLAQANAADLFSNETRPGPNQAIELRHRESGLVCLFNPGARFEKRLKVYPSAKRGDDVGCSAETTGDTRSFYAVRASSRSVEDILDEAVEAFALKYPDAKPIAISEAAARTNNGITIGPYPLPLPPSQTRRFLTQNSYEQVSAAVVNGWEITMRFSGAPHQGSVVGGQTTWEQALYEIVHPTAASRAQR